MTIAQMLKEIAGEICDKYCKWPEQCTDQCGLDECELDQHCDVCPLGKLI